MNPTDSIIASEALPRLRAVGEAIRDEIGGLGRAHRDNPSDAPPLDRVGAESDDDTLYRLDLVVEKRLLSACEEWAEQEGPFFLVAEGLHHGGLMLPSEAPADEARFIVIADPVDGTRGLMVDKRSAWFLGAAAPIVSRDSTGRPAATLSDIVCACQVELPRTKQYLADVLWASVDEEGFGAERVNVLTGEAAPVALTPSSAETLDHGFACMVKYFPGAKAVAVEIEQAVFAACATEADPGKARVFDDQYISTGGQLYELIAGHDRLVIDLRPVLDALSGTKRPGLAAHPYDACTELIARKAGVTVGGVDGNPLTNPLNVTDPVAWIGAANRPLFDKAHRALTRELERLRAGDHG